MLFVSRFVVSVGALFASARDFSSRSHPGDYASLTNWGPVISTAAWVRGHSATPALNVKPSALVSRFVSSRRRVKRPRLSLPPERLFVKRPLALAAPSSVSTQFTHPNLTQPGNGSSDQSIVLTVLPYDGPKDLAYRDDRRALTVHGYTGSRELVNAVYWRSASLVIYTGSIDYVRLYVNPSHYELIAHIYRPRFVTGIYLANNHGHLDPTDFERWVVDNPVNALMHSDLPHLLQASFFPPQYITIGRFERQLEERIAWILASFYALGFLFTLSTMLFEEYIELRKVLGQSAALSSDSNCDLFALPNVAYPSPSKEFENMAKGNWWKIGEEETRTSKYSTSITFPEFPVITTLDLTPPTNAYAPIPPSTSTNIQTSVEVSLNPSAPSLTRKALPTRPGGPRFRTAAWRRCRTK
ncbi:unnamed protein product [Rhizoctonia solani]|uniref:Transmembrane protein n=3 Tax=Rhizoctonia solani TaxID=456999 RepID=A0A8H2XTA8_9AGAM|nr:transmembrane protein, putative [Rhizoctonia solani AG-3 Rhs1AP]KEP46901.1 putative transmembrane protein [Rhizoctonia solani 123E]CAE6432375.1 unnamed protein product [Rhizoctonia solani]CAE6433714.1 unnamed protein product [Rhizoctonia solani]